MIRQITGELLDTRNGQTVINVNGIGYLIHTKDVTRNANLRDTITLHTYLAVRETALDLYGFETSDELEVFKLLIGLPKIGPKSAMQIMSQADIELLKEAVQKNDPVYLSKLSGIGKKSAEKIVAGLKEKLDDIGDPNSQSDNTNQNTHITDTVDALLTLGYSEVEARRVTVEITNDPEIKDSQTALKLALKLLNK